MMDVASTLGDRLRVARERRGLKLADIASQLGTRERTVERWETGLVDIPFSRLVAVARITGAPLSRLTRGLEQMEEAASS